MHKKMRQISTKSFQAMPHQGNFQKMIRLPHHFARFKQARLIAREDLDIDSMTVFRF